MHLYSERTPDVESILKAIYIAIFYRKYYGIIHVHGNILELLPDLHSCSSINPTLIFSEKMNYIHFIVKLRICLMQFSNLLDRYMYVNRSASIRCEAKGA